MSNKFCVSDPVGCAHQSDYGSAIQRAQFVEGTGSTLFPGTFWPFGWGVWARYADVSAGGTVAPVFLAIISPRIIVKSLVRAETLAISDDSCTFPI